MLSSSLPEMASLKDFFPLGGPQKPPQKNFIKENIQNVKRCTHSSLRTHKGTQENNLPSMKYIIREDGQRMVKSNIKVISKNHLAVNTSQMKQNTSNYARRKLENTITNHRTKSFKNQECQTDDVSDNVQCQSDDVHNQFTCHQCGYVINGKDVDIQKIGTNESRTDKQISSVNINSITSQNETYPHSIEDKCNNAHGSVSIHNANRITHKENICKKQGDVTKLPSSYKIGLVPRYLKERNTKWQQEQKEVKEREKIEKALGLKDPECPPGHMLMPKEERARRILILQKGTILKLNKNAAEFDEQITVLNMLPVSSDSFRVRQRKIEVEKELNRLENAMGMLQKSKVFVKIENQAMI